MTQTDGELEMLDVYKYWFYDLGNLWSNVNIMSCWASVTFRFPPTDRVTPVSQCLCNGETQSRDINLSAWSLQEITHFTDLIDSQISKMVLHTQTPLSFAAGWDRRCGCPLFSSAGDLTRGRKPILAYRFVCWDDCWLGSPHRSYKSN